MMSNRSRAATAAAAIFMTLVGPACGDKPGQVSGDQSEVKRAVEPAAKESAVTANGSEKGKAQDPTRVIEGVKLVNLAEGATVDQECLAKEVAKFKAVAGQLIQSKHLVFRQHEHVKKVTDGPHVVISHAGKEYWISLNNSNAYIISVELLGNGSLGYAAKEPLTTAQCDLSSCLTKK